MIMARNISRTGLTALFLLGLWQGIVTLFAPPAFILPGPVAVVHSIWTNFDLLMWHAGVTMVEITAGAAFGLTLGMALALAMAQWPRVREMLQPLLIFSQIVPVFALAPLLTLWLGFGFWPKVVMATLVTFFPVASAFLDGLLRTKTEWLDLADLAAATPLRRMFLLRLPAAVPELVTGLSLALIYAPIGAVIGEWVGAAQGLGYLMLFANGRAKADLMFAALLVLTGITLIFYHLILAMTKRLLARYLQR